MQTRDSNGNKTNTVKGKLAVEFDNVDAEIIALEHGAFGGMLTSGRNLLMMS